MATQADALFDEALKTSEPNSAPKLGPENSESSTDNPPSQADSLFEEASAQTLTATPDVQPPPPGTIRREETDTVAAKYKVDPQELYEMSAFLGNQPEKPLEEPAQAVREVAGFLGRAFALNIPQFLLKKAQAPEMRQALDEVADLAEQRKPTADMLAEAAGAVTGSVGIARGAAKLLGGAGTKAAELFEAASAVGGSATQAAATAKEGEELEAAGQGALFGGLLYGGAKGLSMLLPTKATYEAGEQALESAARRADDAGPQVAFERAAQDERIAVRAAEEADKFRALDDEAVNAALSIPGTLPDDSAELARVILREEGLARVAGREEQRLAALADDAGEAVGNLLPTDPSLRAATLASHAVEAELRATARFLDDMQGPSRRQLDARLSTKEALEYIQEVGQREGADYVRQAVKKGQELLAASRVAADEAFAPVRQAFQEAGDPDVLTKLFDALQDGRFVARAIDDRLGTNMERALDDFATQTNYYTRHLSEIAPTLEDLLQRTRDANLSDDVLYQALDTGANLADDTQQAILNAWRNFYEGVRQEATSLGVQIPKRDNYVPHKVLPMRDLLPRLQAAVETVRQETGIDLKSYKQADYEKVQDNSTWRDLKSSLEYLSGDALNKPEQVRSAVLSALDPALAGQRLRTQASSALERVEDEVPALIRETRAAELAHRWLTNTFRHAYLRGTIDDLRLVRDVAAEAGDKRSASYVQKLLQDVVGAPRKGTLVDAFRRRSLQLQTAMDKVARESTDPLVQTGAKVLAEVPQALQWLTAQVYPNFLGLSVRAVLQNITQPLLVTIPELGGAYGSSRLIAATAQLASDLATGRQIKVSTPSMARSLSADLGRPVAVGEVVVSRNPQLFLEAQGLLGGQWNTAMRDFMEQSVSQGIVGSMPSKAIQKFNSASMYLYERAERANRIITTYMAQGVADDLLSKGSVPAAEEFLNQVGDSYRRAISKARDAGDAEQTRRLVQDYLIGKTVFNYTRASMSEFGRTMGTLFSVFTKWPATIAGDIVDTLRRQGAADGGLRLAGKYLAPLMLLHGVQELAFGEDKETPAYQAFAGKSGLPGWAPVRSVVSFLDGNLLQPPVLSTLAGGLKSLATMDPKTTVKWLDDTVRSFVPGAGLLRFMATDLRAIQGEQPVQGGASAQAEEVFQ